jgi:hypothetical protein
MTDPHALADRRWFRLAPGAWEDFVNHVARPPVFKPHLSDLLHEDNWADEESMHSETGEDRA